MKYTILAIIVLGLLGFFGYKMFPSDKESQDKTGVVINVATTTEEVKKDNNMYYADLEKSKVSWSGGLLSGVKSHKGTIKLLSGEGKFENGMITTGKFVIDMNSISDSDLTKEEDKQKLEGHLKSDDFFAVAMYPTSSLEVLSVSTTTKKDIYNIKAKLTIKATTKEVTFPLVIGLKDGILNATGKVVFNRADFEVKYGSKSFFKNLGDKVIKDEVEITLDLSSKPLDVDSFPSSI